MVSVDFFNNFVIPAYVCLHVLVEFRFELIEARNLGKL